MAKARILLVDDESLIALDIRSSLENFGYEVCGMATRGEDAVALARQHKPDLVLMDIKLEGEMDGIEAARLINAELGTFVIYLTAHSDEQMLQRAKATRPMAYLLKPFAERELYVSLEMVLSRRPPAPMLEIPDTESYYTLRHQLAQASLDGGGSDDLSADVLDILSAAWLQQADNPDSCLSLSADEILRSRGLLPQKGGTGHRGGYKQELKDKVAAEIALLARLAAPGGGPLLVARPGSAPFSWELRPGDWLTGPMSAPERPTALLSQPVVGYDPYRQKWEKRLGRYLAREWGRQGGAVAVAIGPLLAHLQVPLDETNPARTRSRLEKALDTLARDGVLEQWEYAGLPPGSASRKGWLEAWLLGQIRLVPPAAVLDQYRVAKTAGAARSPQARPFALAFLRQIRESRGLSQFQAARSIGITQARLSQLENGGKASPPTFERIRAWILKQIDAAPY